MRKTDAQNSYFLFFIPALRTRQFRQESFLFHPLSSTNAPFRS